ncbi:MAG: winged helix-turn-helix domain-containing protein [Thermovirgaceae bacterium]|nr:winged helix-turn-helix domain-containing protein [Thermovirgaceae bacterium]
MLESFITSKTRVRLLLKFFLNPGTSAYLRGLADEFGESTNGVRVELNRLSEAGILESTDEGRTKVYRANEKHPLFPEIRRIVAKTVGLDRLVEQVVSRLGNVELALVTGDYAKGVDSGLIDLVLVGDVDQTYLVELVKKAEAMIERKIRTLVLKAEEYKKLEEKFKKEKALVLWE